MPQQQVLVQFSDVHIVARGTLAYGRVDTAAMLSKAVERANHLAIRPVAVLVTGDLADSGADVEYSHLRALLEPLEVPFYLMPGNHDSRAALLKAFPDHTYLRTIEGFIQYSVMFPGMRLVALDSVVSSSAHGELCKVRLSHAAAMLADDPVTPTLLALHHPPYRSFVQGMDQLRLINGAQELEQIVRANSQIERVLCGHIHRCSQSRWGGTIAVTAPSTAYQVPYDVASDVAPCFSLEPPGFLLHCWTEKEPVVSHLMFSDSFGGPFLFG